MKISCSRDTLIENINIVSHAVTIRSNIEILDCIRLYTKDNEFKMTANDLKLAIETTKIDAEIIEEGSVAIEAKILNEIIKKLPDGIIMIESDENNIVEIKCEKSKFKIIGRNSDDFPSLPLVEKNNVISIKSIDFLDMVKQTSFSVSQDESRVLLTGELLEITDTSISMVAIDGYRVAFKTIDNAQNIYTNKDIIIPGKSLLEISKIIDKDKNEKINIYISDNNIMFENKKCLFVSRLLDGEFIKYNQLFTTDWTTKITINRNDLLRSLDRSLLVAVNPKRDPVKFNITNNVLALSSKTDISTFFEEIAIDSIGNDLEISFNPRYIIDALKNIEENTVTIQYTNSLSPCTIFSEENSTYKYLILPLRI